MANESNVECTDRLRRQGKWEEASRYKDEVKRCLREGGKTKREANDLAWEAMHEKCPAVRPETDELLGRLMAVRYPPRGQDSVDDKEL